MADLSIRTSRPGPPHDEYVYRRPIEGRDLIPAVAAGIATGIVAFYIATILLERTPLLPGTRPFVEPRASTRGR